MDQFRCCVIEFEIKCTDSIKFDGFWGSLIRGGFGHRFRSMSCSRPTELCETCLLKDQCAYAYIFETPIPANLPNLKGLPFGPHPFVLRAPMLKTQRILAGFETTVGFVLIGKAIDYLGYFIYTMEELARIGLTEGKGKFSIKSLHSLKLNGDRSLLYDPPTGNLVDVPHIITLSEIQETIYSMNTCSQITMDFLTPVRLKAQGKLYNSIPFELLMKTLLRRITSLDQLHCSGTWKPDHASLLTQASTVSITSAPVSWQEFKRYSYRQKSLMKFGGVLGTFQIAGELTLLFPLLKLGELIHVGKGTSFGFGQYKIIDNVNTP